MTAPLDLIVAPRPEPAALKTLKLEKASGETTDRFADHMRESDSVSETPESPKNNVLLKHPAHTLALTTRSPVTNSIPLTRGRRTRL